MPPLWKSIQPMRILQMGPGRGVPLWSWLCPRLPKLFPHRKWGLQYQNKWRQEDWIFGPRSMGRWAATMNFLGAFCVDICKKRKLKLSNLTNRGEQVKTNIINSVDCWYTQIFYSSNFKAAKIRLITRQWKIISDSKAKNCLYIDSKIGKKIPFESKAVRKKSS